jgi:hypothetical protein
VPPKGRGADLGFEILMRDLDDHHPVFAVKLAVTRDVSAVVFDRVQDDCLTVWLQSPKGWQESNLLACEHYSIGYQPRGNLESNQKLVRTAKGTLAGRGTDLCFSHG